MTLKNWTCWLALSILAVATGHQAHAGDDTTTKKSEVLLDTDNDTDSLDAISDAGSEQASDTNDEKEEEEAPKKMKKRVAPKRMQKAPRVRSRAMRSKPKAVKRSRKAMRNRRRAQRTKAVKENIHDVVDAMSEATGEPKAKVEAKLKENLLGKEGAA